MKKSAFVISLLALGWSVPAQAGDTVTYRYDAKGRLVKVERTGTVNNGATTNYEHDRAHNRKRVVTTGAPAP
jgi:RHS Repeat